MYKLKEAKCPICQEKLSNLTYSCLLVNGLANCSHCFGRVFITRSRLNILILVSVMLISILTCLQIDSLGWIISIFASCGLILIAHTHFTSGIVDARGLGNPHILFGHYCRVFLVAEEISFYDETIGKNIEVKKTKRRLYTTLFIMGVALVFIVVPTLGKGFDIVYLLLPAYTYLDLKIRFENVVESEAVNENEEPYLKLNPSKKVSVDGIMNLFIHIFIFFKIYDFISGQFK